VDISTSINQVNILFGSRLSSVRRAKRVSQTELGRRVKLSRTTIANLEAGLQNVQLHQVFSLARALDADPNELIPSVREFEAEEQRRNDLLLQQIREELLQIMGEAHAES